MTAGRLIYAAGAFPDRKHDMLSHVVIFWTKPSVPDAAARLLEGAKKHLASIPGVLGFHVGRMVPSERPVVDQSYQVALLVQLPDKAAEQAYQVHPQHIQFIEEYCKPCLDRALVYDFSDN